jgi:hypothetical protein
VEPEHGLIALFVRPLNQLELPYLITGGVASIVYGEPRFTRDIDLVLQLGQANIVQFVSAWPPDRYYVPPIDVIQAESARTEYGHFNISHQESALRADIYLVGNDPLMMWAMERPHLETVGSDIVRLAPIEYVIVQKLRYFRDSGSDRHLADVGRMLRIEGDSINQSALDKWLSKFELTQEWKHAQRFRI